jgi:hypothetical protein
VTATAARKPVNAVISLASAANALRSKVTRKLRTVPLLEKCPVAYSSPPVTRMPFRSTCLPSSV